MAYNTIIQQGSFVATGNAVFLNIRSGTDWFETYNYTQIAANAVSTGYKFYWQNGFVNGTMIEEQSNAGGTAVNMIITANNVFSLVDSTVNAPGPAVATTASTNATQPVVSTGSTAGLADNSVVRIIHFATQPNLNGYDFGINTIVANMSFTIAPVLANAPGAVGGAGFYRIIPFDSLFYPSDRRVVNISQAANAQVTTSVPHKYVVGQSIRFHVSAPFGMTQIDGLIGNVASIVDTYNFTVDINTTAFTAFVFPLAASYPFSPAMVNPVGEETDANSNPNLLDDATVNTGFIGVQLQPGVDGPAGQSSDVIYWRAGKSFNL